MGRTLAVVFVLGSFVCCANAAVSTSAAAPSSPSPASLGTANAPIDAFGADAAPLTTTDAGGGQDATLPFDDPMALHFETPGELRALMGEATSVPFPVGGGPWRLSQGNRAISHHAIGPRACLDGLRDVVLQTPEQRARCGAEAMVPVWERGGSIDTARYCIDVFEFPDQPVRAALRLHHAGPGRAGVPRPGQAALHPGRVEPRLPRRPERRPGPRLRVRGRDGPDRLQHEQVARARVRPATSRPTRRLWTTCGTNTEPSGAFPALPLALRRLRPARQRRRDHDALRACRRQDVLAAEGQRVLLRRRREEADRPGRLLDQVPRPVQLRPALARREDRGGLAHELPPRFSLLQDAGPAATVAAPIERR